MDPGFETTENPRKLYYPLKGIQSLRISIKRFAYQHAYQAYQHFCRSFFFVFQDIALKLELLQASSSTNGVNGMPNGGEGAKVTFVKVVTPEGQEIEFPTDEAGNLSLKSVTDIHGPGVNALKYKTANNATRIVRLANQVFYAPEDGWGTR